MQLSCKLEYAYDYALISEVCYCGMIFHNNLRKKSVDKTVKYEK